MLPVVSYFFSKKSLSTSRPFVALATPYSPASGQVLQNCLYAHSFHDSVFFNLSPPATPWRSTLTLSKCRP
jgi:hypothetical protein